MSKFIKYKVVRKEMLKDIGFLVEYYRNKLSNHSNKCNNIKFLIYNLYCIDNNKYKQEFELLKNYNLNMIVYNSSRSTYNKVNLNEFTLKDFIKHIYLSNKILLTYHLYDNLQVLSCYDDFKVIKEIKNHVRYPLTSVKQTLNNLCEYYIGKQLRRFEAHDNILNCEWCSFLINEKYNKYRSGFCTRYNSKKEYEYFYNMKLKDFLQLLKDLDLFIGSIKNDELLLENYFKSTYAVYDFTKKDEINNYLKTY